MKRVAFVTVAKIHEIPPGQFKSFTVSDKPILVANFEGTYYAIGGKCTHMGGDLAKGKLEGKVMQCPRHGARFDVTTGQAVSGPKIGPLKLKAANETRYAVRVQGDEIQVSV
jgi:3-phenylpropionate/trans-cinnamate dioxygenase ferredoxin subunit